MRMSQEQFDALTRKPGYAQTGSAPTVVIPTTDTVTVHRRAQKMNKTEALYAQLLDARQHLGEITWYAFERIRLRLADRTFFHIDFSVLMPDNRLEFHEVKGFWRDDARVKIKVAAEQYPFRFLAVTKRRMKDGGGWAFEEFG